MSTKSVRMNVALAGVSDEPRFIEAITMRAARRT